MEESGAASNAATKTEKPWEFRDAATTKTKKKYEQPVRLPPPKRKNQVEWWQ